MQYLQWLLLICSLSRVSHVVVIASDTTIFLLLFLNILTSCWDCKWIPAERRVVPRGHACLLPTCSLLPLSMLCASCIMYACPLLCRAHLNLAVYSLSFSGGNPRLLKAWPCDFKKDIGMQSVLQKKKVFILIQEQQGTKPTALCSIVYFSLYITKNTIWILAFQTHSPKPLIILTKTVTGKSVREKMMQQCFFCISSFPAICHPNIEEQSPFYWFGGSV